MPITLLDSLANDAALRPALRSCDKRRTRKAALEIAESLNALQRISQDEERLIATKRSKGSLAVKIERKYMADLKTFYRGEFRRGIDAARELIAQLEKSGVNLVVSRHIQDAVIGGKLPLGSAARDCRRRLSQDGLELAALAREFGVKGDAARAFAEAVSVSPSVILNLKVIMPNAVPAVTALLPGIGISPPDWGHVDGPPAASLGIQAPVPVQKGLDMLIEDLVFKTDMTTTSYVATRMMRGVPRARPGRTSSRTSSSEEMESVGSALSGWGQVAAGLIILAGGILQASPLLIVGGILAILWGLFEVLLEEDEAAGASFVDP